MPVPQRRETPSVVTEPEPPTWSDIELHLAQYEDVLRTDPSLRDHMRSLAHQLLQCAKQLPKPMPSAVTAAFARIDVGKA